MHAFIPQNNNSLVTLFTLSLDSLLVYLSLDTLFLLRRISIFFSDNKLIEQEINIRTRHLPWSLWLRCDMVSRNLVYARFVVGATSADTECLFHIRNTRNDLDVQYLTSRGVVALRRAFIRDGSWVGFWKPLLSAFFASNHNFEGVNSSSELQLRYTECEKRRWSGCSSITLHLGGREALDLPSYSHSSATEAPKHTPAIQEHLFLGKFMTNEEYVDDSEWARDIYSEKFQEDS